MEKTAVEWLLDNLKEVYPNIDTYSLIIDEAKTIEEEQIDEAYDSGWYDGSQEDSDNRTYKDYYEETFKSEQHFTCGQFTSDDKTSSATKCICGKEKFEHINIK
jgi:hypothetical protein